MKEEIEIELKNQLIITEFQQLQKKFNIKDTDLIEQHNYYFDTPSFLLKQNYIALRIREKNGNFILTMKKPHGEDMLERNEELNPDFANRLLDGDNIFHETEIGTLLNSVSIPVNRIAPIGLLSTRRAEFPYCSGLLALDHSLYLGKEDFEVEFEVNDRKLGEKEFKELLIEQNIPIRPTLKKIERFFLAKEEAE